MSGGGPGGHVVVVELVVVELVVVVGGGGGQPAGSGSHAAATHAFAENFPGSSFLLPVQRMQNFVPFPNWSCALTVPCWSSSSVNVMLDLIFTESFPSFTWAEFRLTLSLNFHLEPVFFQRRPAGRTAQRSSVAL